MPASPFPLPDSHDLIHWIEATFNQDDFSMEGVSILAREPSPFASTYPSEVVTCRLTDGRRVQLLCKYEAGFDHTAFGHRGGVAYEAEIYRQVLKPLPVSKPKFYGLYKDEITGGMWFVTEYIDNSSLVKDSRDHTLMYAAARWLGAFHQTNEARLSPDSMPFLNRYDAEYYLGWAERTSKFAGFLHHRYPWLEPLCKRFKEVIDKVLESTAIIIHGEYYPNNILFSQGTIYPVDWESTAIAIGEIDLASLIEHWPSTIVENCIAEYKRARWSGVQPADFERNLDVAKLYWRFRWLGEKSEWTTEEKSRWRFEELRSLGGRLGLI